MGGRVVGVGGSERRDRVRVGGGEEADYDGVGALGLSTDSSSTSLWIGMLEELNTENIPHALKFWQVVNA